jgi:Icc-related predicted phosphoesterase
VIIAATSDLHGNLPDLPLFDFDVAVIAGDICPNYYSPRDAVQDAVRQYNWLDGPFRSLIEALRAQSKSGHVLWTWGNHDFVGERKLYPTDMAGLVDEPFELDGVKFWFTPWVPNLRAWAFSGNGDVPQMYRDSIPVDTDVLVSHGPPASYGDAEIFLGEHCGSENLKETIEQIVQPKIVICGHIHEGRGVYETPYGGHIYNVASLNRQYEPYPERWTRIEL